MTASPYLAITTTHHSGQRSVLRLRGELDVCTNDRLRLAISSALAHSPRLLVVDLSALGFMDCSGLSVLVWAHQRLAEQGSQLHITGAQPIVQRLIRLTGLDTHLHLSAPEPGGSGHPSAPHMGARNSTPARRNRPGPEQSTTAEGHALAAIRASATLFRVGFASDMVAATCWLLLAMALYLLLNHVHQLAAAAMATFVAVGAAIQYVNQLNQYTALTIATSDHYTHAFGVQAPTG